MPRGVLRGQWIAACPAGLTWRTHSCVPCRHSWRHKVDESARRRGPQFALRRFNGLPAQIPLSSGPRWSRQAEQRAAFLIRTPDPAMDKPQSSLYRERSHLSKHPCNFPNSPFQSRIFEENKASSINNLTLCTRERPFPECYRGGKEWRSRPGAGPARILASRFASPA